MKLKQVMKTAIEPALSLLPERMRSDETIVMLLAIGLQESRFTHTYQIVQGKPSAKGPARGWWQFERMGGVHGVLTHVASKPHALAICRARNVQPTAKDVWERLEHDQILAAAFTRLLLWTDPRSLPKLGDEQGAWDLYMRVWRPGKPHLRTWAACYADALKEV